ncbi:MAG TPA: hypothetical protein VHF23_06410 [Gaiellaceae bacterium]|nr:hypothetical protein [Gaiellaceae bacterium]
MYETEEGVARTAYLEHLIDTAVEEGEHVLRERVEFIGPEELRMLLVEAVLELAGPGG